ncbi:MAG: glycerophosphodiester phosphodiesterase family protein [Pseudomonadota bacterium]
MILGARAFAHRGLWAAGGPPENSIAAFRAAALAGVGIELDVQLSADNVPIVFHDPMLERMTKGQGAVWHQTADDLTALSLAGTDERIPTLTAVLSALPKDTPVLIELKASPGDPAAYIDALQMAVFGTRAAIAAMSFVKPLNTALQSAALPHTRGVLFAPTAFDTAEAARPMIEDAVALSPTYLAPHHSQVATVRSLVGPDLPLAAWTVDTPEALAAVKKANAAIIFEHLDPALVIAP